MMPRPGRLPLFLPSTVWIRPLASLASYLFVVWTKRPMYVIGDSVLVVFFSVSGYEMNILFPKMPLLQVSAFIYGRPI